MLAGDATIPTSRDESTTSLRRCDSCSDGARRQPTGRSESQSQEADAIRSDLLGTVAGLLRLRPAHWFVFAYIIIIIIIIIIHTFLSRHKVVTLEAVHVFVCNLNNHHKTLLAAHWGWPQTENSNFTN